MGSEDLGRELPAVGRFARQLEEHIGGASEVVIYDGIAGFGDQQLPALQKSLSELGFHQEQSDHHAFAEISVWVR